jgi:23S rRNA (cytidine1920-2'-O)/16S rRNA (cytidine1409-2'-O)-methyltransferase
VRRARLDAELVRRGLARSREEASELIAAGRVTISGRLATKPATAVDPGAPLLVKQDVTVEGRRCLDAGASTGGFTDVLLRRGAKEVVAVDVGYGQLVWRLQTDLRVKLHDRTNVRTLTPEAIGGPAELIVADLSFISLTLVLPALTACATLGADLVPMVKPQFEVGRDRLGAGGVVRDLGHRADAVAGVVRAAGLLGWGLAGVVASPLPGPSGNVEFFVHLRQDAPTDDAAAERGRQAIAEAVEKGGP